MNNKQRIAIDMDEVIADTIEKFIAIYKREHNLEILLDSLHGKEFATVLPQELIGTNRKYINEPGFQGYPGNAR
jgi:5'(3')-deoxyribonucleotidase